MIAILPSLISSHQAALIKGRTIQNYTTMTFELYKTLNFKIQGGSLCPNPDISKAFDKLNWPFLFQALKLLNFSVTWISLIQECISTTTDSVLVNCIHQGLFPSSCGLRQGDTLSHYSFILEEEIPSHHIQNLQSQGIIHTLSKISSAPCHLLYVDDARVKTFLYQVSSCQTISFLKSQFQISKKDLLHPRYASIYGFAWIPGDSFSLWQPRKRYFLPLPDLLNSKLSAWKAKSLSFDSSLILI
eukprot:TRINITY_DN12116_c1_g1_i1.p1 TRINITY_DN12116_c1_g1~~TRINITY_DN12116_c1_g1_i1.p1  ORF type:complete len:244 (+),score=18.26 TRINITY_DN12116_c1_g1_i1:1906-2637(+)